MLARPEAGTPARVPAGRGALVVCRWLSARCPPRAGSLLHWVRAIRNAVWRGVLPRRSPSHFVLSWCDQSWRGLCDQSWKSEASAMVFVVGCEQRHEGWGASAEDRALRGRNLSAVRSLANGRSGRRGGPACPCRSQYQSEKSLLPHSGSVFDDSSFDRTQNSSFESYTTSQNNEVDTGSDLGAACLLESCSRVKT